MISYIGTAVIPFRLIITYFVVRKEFLLGIFPCINIILSMINKVFIAFLNNTIHIDMIHRANIVKTKWK